MFNRPLLLGGILTTLAASSFQSAYAQSLSPQAYSIDTTSNQLVKIDLASGQTTDVGSLGSYQFAAITFGLNGNLYAVDKSTSTSALYTIDIQSAAVSKIADLSIGLDLPTDLTVDEQGRLFVVYRFQCSGVPWPCGNTLFQDDSLLQINTTNGNLSHVARLKSDQTTLAFGKGRFWHSSNTLFTSKISSYSNSVSYFAPSFATGNLNDSGDEKISLNGMAMAPNAGIWGVDGNGDIYTLDKAIGRASKHVSSYRSLSGLAIDGASTDSDNDSVPDLHDHFPFNSAEIVDSDGDGIGDNSDKDDDNDGLSDIDEINLYGTDPLSYDSDADRVSDKDEIDYGRNPLAVDSYTISDSDADGFTDLQEFNSKTNPFSADSKPPLIEYYVESFEGDNWLQSLLKIDSGMAPYWQPTTEHANHGSKSLKASLALMSNSIRLEGNFAPGTLIVETKSNIYDSSYHIQLNGSAVGSYRSKGWDTTRIELDGGYEVISFVTNFGSRANTGYYIDNIRYFSKGTDTDQDGMTDLWEYEHQLDFQKTDDSADFDNDGFTNLAEFVAGSEPNNPDSIPSSRFTANFFYESFEDGTLPEQLILTDGTNGYDGWQVVDGIGKEKSNALSYRKIQNNNSLAYLYTEQYFKKGKLYFDTQGWGTIYVDLFSGNEEPKLRVDATPMLRNYYIEVPEGRFQYTISARADSDNALMIDNIVFIADGTDNDKDGMDDQWEHENGFNVLSSADASLDRDGDGFSNLQEYLSGSDPFNTQQTPSSDMTSNFYYENFEKGGLPSQWWHPYGLLEKQGGLNNSGALFTTELSERDELRSSFFWEQSLNNGRVYFDYKVDPKSPDGQIRVLANSLPQDGIISDTNHPGQWKQMSFPVTKDDNIIVIVTNRIKSKAIAIDNFMYIADGYDNDNDGIADQWEYENGFDVFSAADASLDVDGDGLSNLQEFQKGTSPFSTDTDNDGISDAQDSTPGNGVAEADIDGDGLNNSIDLDDDGDGINDSADSFPWDATESQDHDLDGIGNNKDTDDDGDGVPDVADAFPYDPTESTDFDGDGIGDNADTDDDNDGVPDEQDAFARDPNESLDTDGDGIGNNADTDDDNDGVDDINDAFALDASESVDTDGDGIGNKADTDDDNDGLSDVQELETTGTNPLLADSDSDGLNDGVEINQHRTNPLKADTDDDGLLDGFEIANGFDPLVPEASVDSDPDGDGLSNAREMVLGTNPMLADSDADGLNDAVEVDVHGTNPLNADSDEDTLSDFDELQTHGSNPLKTDSDDDQMPDSWEVKHKLNVTSDDSQEDKDLDGRDNLTEFKDDTDPNTAEVVDKEANETLATAQNIDQAFSLNYSADIGDATQNTSETLPHVTILGKGVGQSDVDVYSFTVEKANSRVILDIDRKAGQGTFFDSYIEVVSENGVILYSNDDSTWFSVGQGGSTNVYDAYLEVVIEQPGKYYVKVMSYPDLPITSGAGYSLQVSVENHTVATK